MSSNHHSRLCSVYTAISTTATSHDAEFRTVVRKAVSSRTSLLRWITTKAPLRSRTNLSLKIAILDPHMLALTYFAKVINVPAQSRSGDAPTSGCGLWNPSRCRGELQRVLHVPLASVVLCCGERERSSDSHRPALRDVAMSSVLGPYVCQCHCGATWGRGERDADMGGMRDGQSPSCRLVAVFAPSSQASRFLRATR
jgi:hypothetical protein